MLGLSRLSADFEKINHNTDVDKVMEEVVKNIPESIKFIDDRGKYFSESFFLEFDHPSDKYFKELKNKIILLEKEWKEKLLLV